MDSFWRFVAWWLIIGIFAFLSYLAFPERYPGVWGKRSLVVAFVALILSTHGKGI